MDTQGGLSKDSGFALNEGTCWPEIERQGALLLFIYGGPAVPGSVLNAGTLVLSSHSQECIEEGKGRDGEKWPPTF